jgi:ABC-type oligopeptide transport system substrate-binding subunit
MNLSDEQLGLLEERLRAIGVTRRDFLGVVAAMAAAGGVGFSARAGAGKPSKPAPGEKLAKEQVIRLGGGGYYGSDPASHDFNKDLFCGGEPALFAGLMRFNADFVAVPHLATKVESNKDGSVWTFRMRKDSRWSNGAPCTAHDFVWSWKRQLDPATAAPYAAFLYDIKNAEAFNKGAVKDAGQVGVRAKDDYTLEAALEGPRGYFPVLSAYLAALPAYRPAVEKHGDRWTEAGNIVSNGAFMLESWDHHRQFTLRKNPHYYDAKNVHLERVNTLIIPLASGFLPYENNETDFSLVPPGDLKRAQADPKLGKEVFRYTYPGTWYLIPQVTKPPFDNLKVRRAISRAVDRDAVGKVSQGFGIPAHGMIPPGFPGYIDDRKVREIQRFDPRTAIGELEGTPFEGGKNWPKVVISMREEGYGAKPMAEAVQTMLLEHLHMRSELEVLEPRVFRERLWKHDLQLVWIRWFMDYPDPHNEYFDTFYGKRTTGKRQAWSNDEFDRLLEMARAERDEKKRMDLYRKAEGVLQTDVGYVPVAWVVRYAAFKPWVRGVEKNRFGEPVVDGNIYVDMLTHLYVVERR